MKKIVSISLLLVMALTLLTGCGDPILDDLSNYLNVEMTEVNANYEKIKEEAGKWGEFEEDAQLIVSLNDVLLPLVNDSLVKLEGINPETEEVKAVKAKYVKTMEAYKAGFSEILEGVQELSEEKMTTGSEKVEQALVLLDEYNAALEALAEQVGVEIEY